MNIRFKILSVQGVLLSVVLVISGFFVVIFNNSINSLLDNVIQDVEVIRKINTLEDLTLKMRSLREDLEHNTDDYISSPNESTIAKYSFASQKLSKAVNSAFRESDQGSVLFNVNAVKANIEDIEKNIFLLVEQNNIEAARALQSGAEYAVLSENYYIFIEQFIFRHKAEAEDQFSTLILLPSSIEASRQQLNNLLVIALITFTVLFVLGVVFSFVITRSLFKVARRTNKGNKTWEENEIKNKNKPAH